MIGATALIFGLIEGQDLGWFKPRASLIFAGHVLYSSKMPISIVAIALIGGLLALTCFVLLEQKREAQGLSVVLNISLFKIKTFAWGNLTATVVAAGEFALMFILPLYMANAMGLSLIETGAIIGSMALGAFFSGAMARHLAAKIGAGGTVIVGLVLEIIGSLLTMVLMRPTLSPWLFAVGLLIYGIGLGLASAQLTSVVLAKVPVAQSGAASATQSTVRQLGSAIGAAIAGTSLSTGLIHFLPEQLMQLHKIPKAMIFPLVGSTISSAGGMIEAFRADLHVLAGFFERLAPHAPAPSAKLNASLVQTLANGFADASQWAIGIAVCMMLIGLGGAYIVYRDLQKDK